MRCTSRGPHRCTLTPGVTQTPGIVPPRAGKPWLAVEEIPGVHLERVVCCASRAAPGSSTQPGAGRGHLFKAPVAACHPAPHPGSVAVLLRRTCGPAAGDVHVGPSVAT